MKTALKIFAMFNLSLFLSCCRSNIQPSILPGIVPHSQKTTVAPKRVTNIIGAVEPVYMLPMKSAFEARIDTGATTSSIDAVDIHEFERDGENWVSFNIINRQSGEKHTFEKPILQTITIKRINEKEQRYKVLMDVSLAGEKFAAEFTLAHREDFEYQALIGRNILSGRHLVDTSLSHTLK